MNFNTRRFVTIIFFSYLIICSCTNLKSLQKSEGGTNTAISNAVIDFVNTEKGLVKADDVFRVFQENIDENLFSVGIIGRDTDPLMPRPENKIGSNHPYFPTNYIEKNDKLFYWYDTSSTITEDFITVLSKYNHIDSTNVNGIVELRGTFSNKRGVDYYFCKNNLVKYKKVVTRIAMGYYDPPKLTCGSSD